MTQLTSKVENALHLADKGFHLTPVVENQKKPPVLKDWQGYATRDPKQIRATWEFKPTLNIGCLLLDGFSLDFDVGSGGLESLRRMEAAGLVPRTYTQRSARDGVHKTYRCGVEMAQKLKNAAGLVSGYPGVDIRTGRKGYIVGAGSTTDDGVYSIEDDAPIADAPQSLIDILPKEQTNRALKFEPPSEDVDSAQEVARAIYYLEERAPEAIQGNHGDDTTIVVCNALSDYNISEERAFELLCDWNDTKANPPWDHGELLLKFKSARKSRKSAIGVKSAAVELEAVEIKDLRKDTTAPLPGAWDEPADLWREERPPADMLAGTAPSVAVKFGTDRATSFGVNADAVIATTIAVLGSLIPATNRLQMYQNRSTWSVLPTYWVAAVGDPGSAKTAATKAPLVYAQVINAKWAAEFSEQLKEFEKADLAFSASQAPKKKAHQDNVGQRNENQDFDQYTSLPPKKPKLKSKIANDATTEALATRLAETPDIAPLIMHADELSGWFGSHDAYRAKGTKDRSFYLQAKDGGSYRVDRQGRDAIEVSALAISIVGGVQDDVLAKLAPDLATDGLLQRFGLVAIRQIGLGEDNPEDPSIEAAIPRIASALASIADLTFRFDCEASKELTKIKAFKDREAKRDDIPPGLKTWLSKADSEFGRYALAFHLIEWAAIAEALETPPDLLIPPATARRARCFVEDFLYVHAQYIHGTVLEGGWGSYEVRWVAAYVLVHKPCKLTAREIKKNYRRLASDPRRLQAVMARLELDGWVRVLNSDLGHWSINPMVHDGRFEEIRRREDERRASVRSKIVADGKQRRAGGRQ